MDAPDNINNVDLYKFVISEDDLTRSNIDVTGESMKTAVAKIAALNENTCEQFLIIKQQEKIEQLQQENAELKAQIQQVPNEHGKNRYGLDMAYFRNVINRDLNRPLVDYRPDELARILARMSRTADPSVMQEPEFQPQQRVPYASGSSEEVVHVPWKTESVYEVPQQPEPVQSVAGIKAEAIRAAVESYFRANSGPPSLHSYLIWYANVLENEEQREGE